jgi:cytochrome c oxidase assembly protein subunit 11
MTMASASLAARNRNILMILVGLVAGMAGLAYASVPLYDLFCRVTGYAGTTQRADAAPGAVGARTITVTFNADVHSGLAWRFQPAQGKIAARTGLTYQAVYVAENPTDETITGTATFNVSPDVFGPYFVKIQCFCFERQTLKPHERVEMPVVFFIDPRMEEDSNLKRMTDVTLSYTFFRVEEPADTDQSADITPLAGGGG